MPLPRLPSVQPPWGAIQVAWQQLVEYVESLGSSVETNAFHQFSVQTADYDEAATSGVTYIAADGTLTVNLPTAVGNQARITVKLVSAGTVTITPQGAETIDGAGSASISTLNDSLAFVSDGSNWLTI